MTRNQKRRVRNIKRGIELCRVFNDDDTPHARLFPLAPKGAQILRDAGRIEAWETVSTGSSRVYVFNSALMADSVLWWCKRNYSIDWKRKQSFKGSRL